MLDEYELISKKELEELKGAKTESSLKMNPTNESARIVYLNSNLDKLNHSLKRLLLFFEHAQKEMISSGPKHEHVDQLVSQNEKIANGIVSIANMIRDQQIQLNQMSILYRKLEQRIDEIRLQSRPKTSYKIPSMSKEVRQPPVVKHEETPRSDKLDVQVEPGVSKEIEQEEKNERYAAFDMLGKEDIPPPNTAKKGFLNKFVRK